MDKRQLIIDAVNYVNDIPARVEEFLVKEESKIQCDSIKEKTPTFAIHDWVKRIVGKDKDVHAYGRVFRIESLIGGEIRDSDGNTHFKMSVTHATDNEIENHLRDEAIKKGFIGFAKFNWLDEDDKLVTTIMPCNAYRFIRSLDCLVVDVKECGMGRAIYRNGRWATRVYPMQILLDEYGLKKLMCEFASRFYASDYLSDRDKEVENFLRTKGYSNF